MSRTEDSQARGGQKLARPIGRRGFLALGAATAAAGLPELALAHVPAAGAGVAVGYLSPQAVQDGGLCSAQALWTGDAGFQQRGVRLSVVGMGGTRSPGLQSVTLLAHMAVPGLKDDVDVVHWGMRVQPVESVCGVSNQVLPLGPDADVRLSLAVKHVQHAQERLLPFRLTSGARPGVAKLRPGTYVVAFDGARGGPDWSDHAVRQLDDDAVIELAAADFSYLMLAVDYAS